MQEPRYVILDDDPTGTQAVQDVPVLLRWRASDVRDALEGSPSVHLMTNARALSSEAAEDVTFDAARTALEGVPEARLMLRGDSTLRGHLLAEYRAAAQAAYRAQPPVLLLVPALPAAGRVTLAGIHYADSIPVHETAYAADGVFAYHSSRLLEWAEQRTGGLLAADRGMEIPLARLRAQGSVAVVEAIRAVAELGRAVVAPDVESLDDLELIAAGAREAYADGLPLLVRAAPAFAGVLTGTSARGFCPAPLASDGLLVVCGSYVERTTEQLRSLYAARGIAPVEVDLDALLGDAAAAASERARAARMLTERIAADGLAVLATPRERAPGMRDLDAGQRVAHALASVLQTLTWLPRVVLAKGGITSHVTLTDGLGCDRARVVGPIATGVALWNASLRDRDLSYLVFPGNVGDGQHLAEVVSLVMDG